MSPRQRFTLRDTRRMVPMRFSTGFVVASDRRNVAGNVSLSTVRVSSRIAAQGAGQYYELDRDGDRQIANSIIDGARRRAPTIDVSETAEELYWYVLACAAIVLAVGLLFIRERTDLWIQAAGAALALVLASRLLR